MASDFLAGTEAAFFTGLAGGRLGWPMVLSLLGNALAAGFAAGHFDSQPWQCALAWLTTGVGFLAGALADHFRWLLWALGGGRRWLFWQGEPS